MLFGPMIMTVIVKWPYQEFLVKLTGSSTKTNVELRQNLNHMASSPNDGPVLVLDYNTAPNI